MKTIDITVDSGTRLFIIPDSEAHFDGHPVITYTYSMFLDDDPTRRNIYGREANLHLEKTDDPNYMGYITFEIPDKVFTYTKSGTKELAPGEIEEVIEAITDYRNKSSKWSIDNM